MMRRAGFTLIELMIPLAITGVVLGAAYRLLVANQRFYRSQSVISTVQTNVREAMLILSGELREVSGTGGDIHLMMDTVMTINAMRTLGFVCAVTDQVNGRVTIENASTFAYRAIDVTRDSVFVFREGNSKQSSDDEWMRAQVTGIASNNCTSGAAGTLLRLGPLVGHTFADLDSVTEGAPVRVFATITYRLFEDNGEWWLGVSNFVGGAWTATSPVAGPLRARDGLLFEYLDANGNATATAADVRAVRLTVRGLSTTPIMVAGRPTGNYADSVTVTVALRNN
jgi:prepilin-type N-terminal cleavage/methylation domain-containing protein